MALHANGAGTRRRRASYVDVSEQHCAAPACSWRASRIMNAVRIAVAARQLGKSPETLRRWVRSGCPVAAPGGPGRGKGALLDVAAVRAWRGAVDARSDEMLEQI